MVSPRQIGTIQSKHASRFVCASRVRAVVAHGPQLAPYPVRVIMVNEKYTSCSATAGRSRSEERENFVMW